MFRGFTLTMGLGFRVYGLGFRVKGLHPQWRRTWKMKWTGATGNWGCIVVYRD